MLSATTISIADIVDAEFYSAKIDECEDITDKPFLVVLTWDLTIDDEFGVMATDPTGDGKMQMRTRIFVNETIVGLPTGWQSVYNVFSIPTNFDGDAAIKVVLDEATAINTTMTSQDLSLHKNCVSLHNRTATIHYTIDRSQDVNFSVFNLSGKTFINTGTRHANAGNHSLTVPLFGLANGSYYYTVTTESASFTGKFLYTK